MRVPPEEELPDEVLVNCYAVLYGMDEAKYAGHKAGLNPGGVPSGPGSWGGLPLAGLAKLVLFGNYRCGMTVLDNALPHGGFYL